MEGTSQFLSDQSAALWASSGALLWEGDTGSGLSQVNSSGVSVGFDGDAGVTGVDGQYAAEWAVNGTETVLPNPLYQQNAGYNYTTSVAQGINSSGEMFGTSYTYVVDGKLMSSGSLLWSPSGDATVLQSATPSQAVAMNASGQTVGLAHKGNTHAATEAVKWSATGVKTVLEHGGDRRGYTGQAVAINNVGEVIGNVVGTESNEIPEQAILWSPRGKATFLQDVGGQNRSIVIALNAFGQSVGVSDDSAGGQEAVLWSPTGTGVVLQNPDGFASTAAFAINNAGQSVGYGFLDPDGTQADAVLWSSSGKEADLNKFLGPDWQYSDTFATGINNKGDIIGVGFTNTNGVLNEGSFLLIHNVHTGAYVNIDRSNPTASANALAASALHS
jgi:hypothetical protein